jgi:glycosyltransferase involved in cell wall biosynthesis
MRVTHVITRLVIGGAQENTVASVLGLRRKKGLEVDLISGPATGPEGSLIPLVENEPGLLTVLPALVRPIHPVNDIRALFQLTEIFRRTRPQIVHTHSGKAGILGRLAAARAGVPIIVHTIHGPSFGPFQGAIANFIFTHAERRAGRVTTHFVTVANAMTEQYLRAGIGRPEQYTRIFSGFDTAPFLQTQDSPDLRRQLQIGPDEIVIGKISRLFKLKGHDDLLDAAPGILAQCPNVKFLLVGDGAWRPRLEKKARSLGLQDKFIFAGLVPPEAIPRYLGAMDLLVHLSTREGLARALPQAMAAGRPVVAYDSDGANEVCQSNETGFLVRPHDLPGLTDRIARLVRDPALRQQMGSRGREFVRTLFSVETMVEKLHTLYLDLAAIRQK